MNHAKKIFFLFFILFSMSTSKVPCPSSSESESSSSKPDPTSQDYYSDRSESYSESDSEGPTPEPAPRVLIVKRFTAASSVGADAGTECSAGPGGLESDLESISEVDEEARLIQLKRRARRAKALRRQVHHRNAQTVFAEVEEAMEDFIHAAKKFAQTNTASTEYDMRRAFKQVKKYYLSIPRHHRKLFKHETHELARELEVFDMILKMRMSRRIYQSYKEHYQPHDDPRETTDDVAQERAKIISLAKKFHKRGASYSQLTSVLKNYLVKPYHSDKAQSVNQLRKNYCLALKTFKANSDTMYDICESHDSKPIFTDENIEKLDTSATISQFREKGLAGIPQMPQLRRCMASYNPLFEAKQECEQEFLLAIENWRLHHSNHASKKNPLHHLNRALEIIAFFNNNFEPREEDDDGEEA